MVGLEEFTVRYRAASLPQQARWLAGAGIPCMARARQRLLRQAREQLGLPPNAPEEHIVYEDLRRRGAI